MTKAAFTKAAVVRAIEAVKEGGVEVGTVEIGPDGTIRIMRAVAESMRPVDQSAGVKRWAG